MAERGEEATAVAKSEPAGSSWVRQLSGKQRPGPMTPRSRDLWKEMKIQISGSARPKFHSQLKPGRWHQDNNRLRNRIRRDSLRLWFGSRCEALSCGFGEKEN